MPLNCTAWTSELVPMPDGTYEIVDLGYDTWPNPAKLSNFAVQ